MKYPALQDWWENGKTTSAVTHYRTKTGSVEVYARRNVADRSVMEVARITHHKGFGAAWSLYRHYLTDIPAIAELIQNPQLDAVIEKMGWDHAYRDLIGTPTRVNKAFQLRFPDYKIARNVIEAIILKRNSDKS